MLEDPPEELPDEEPDELLLVVLLELESVLAFESLLVELELDDSLELSFLALPPLLYRSAYQPPPLRMKPAPPDTCRLAVA